MPSNNLSVGMRKNQSSIKPPSREGVILPPPSDGEDRSFYEKVIGTQIKPQDDRISSKPRVKPSPNGLSGTERFFSVPENGSDGAPKLMKNYLKGFLGKNVCVAFWDGDGHRFEKCGILSEVGGDFISIKERKTSRLIITNISEVKYVSVFCV